MNFVFWRSAHPLPDVRVRSLENLLGKLSSDLLSLSSLVHNHRLLQNLVAWFAFDGSSHDVDVLTLLESLAGNAHAAGRLVGFGAITVLQVNSENKNF